MLLSKMKGSITFLDFEKAFDSIIGNSFTDPWNCVNALIMWYTGLSHCKEMTSTFLQNGNFSETINLGRGCRQGEPISSYLLVLATWYIPEVIRENPNKNVSTILTLNTK